MDVRLKRVDEPAADAAGYRVVSILLQLGAVASASIIPGVAYRYRCMVCEVHTALRDR